jgi:hypothetical protein
MTDPSDYFRQLHARVGLGIKVPFRSVSFAGWKPERNKCHDNVDYWAKRHAGSAPIRGWIFWPPDETGRCTFMAHSILMESGALIELVLVCKHMVRRFMTSNYFIELQLILSSNQ